MTERVNLTQLNGDQLERIRQGDGTVYREIVPSKPYGKQQEVPQERKPETEKKHIKRDGRR